MQPHYIIRHQECTGKEIDTIHNILRELRKRYPEASNLILPIEYVYVGKIKSYVKITNEYEKIGKTKKINKQYEICARYCEQIKVTRMDLCVVSNEIQDYFYTNKIIFKYFAFPVSKLNKMEMAEIAEENRWMDLMKMTWFCRRPIFGRTCGICGPCNNTLAGGLGWRLAPHSRLIANIQAPFRKFWRNNYDKQSNRHFQWVKKILKDRY